MLVSVDECALFLSICSPQDEYQMFSLLSQDANGGIGEFFPTLALVRSGLMGADRQGGVEQEYTLVGPTGQVSVGRDRPSQVTFNLLEDVLQ